MFLSCNVYLEYERSNLWILVNERLTISSLRLMTHYVCLIYTALVGLVVNLSLIDLVNRWNWNNLFYSSTLRDLDLEDFQRVWGSPKCLSVFLLIQACVKRSLTNLTVSLIVIPSKFSRITNEEHLPWFSWIVKFPEYYFRQYFYLPRYRDSLAKVCQSFISRTKIFFVIDVGRARQT